MLNEDRARADLLALAGRASTSLLGSVGGKEDAAPIETNVGSLRGIAGVIADLATEVDRCAGSGCMGRKVDDVRLWVTQDRFDAERARAERAVALANSYGAALHAIATAAPDGGALDMLVDWQGHAASLHAAALAALAGADDGTA